MDRIQTKKIADEMSRATSGITGLKANLKVQIDVLEEEIRADEKSKKEYEQVLRSLQDRKDDILKRIDSHVSYQTSFQQDVGPFAQRYKDMTKEIGVIYEQAKLGHSKGTNLLKKEFGYHPAYKRPQDTFSAVPFRPR